MKGVVSLGKQASYGVKMMGVGESFASSPYTPEYKTQITLKEFAEKGEIVLNDLNSLIELENNSLGLDETGDTVQAVIVDDELLRHLNISK